MEKEIKQVVIYTDGACSGNPGNGGWGAVLMYKNKKKEISGGERNTTNNRMELLAPISAFNEGWIESWQSNNWRNANRKEVKNIELWQELLQLTAVHNVTFIKVKGHADNEWNNRCDQLAVMETEKLNLETIEE